VGLRELLNVGRQLSRAVGPEHRLLVWTRVPRFDCDDGLHEPGPVVVHAGFWGWSVHKSVVLMAAELEFTAWSKSGEKLWSTMVEPPWSYQVAGDRIELDVMGNITEFPVSSGPEVIQQ
jgi:hypothetical protein